MRFCKRGALARMCLSYRRQTNGQSSRVWGGKGVWIYAREEINEAQEKTAQ